MIEDRRGFLGGIASLAGVGAGLVAPVRAFAKAATGSGATPGP